MQSFDVKQKVTLEQDTTKEKVRTIHRTVRVSRDAAIKFSVKADLDFSDCTFHDLMRLASEAVWIKIQSRFRAANSEGFVLTADNAKQWERTWDVKKEIIDAERAKATPASKAAAALAAMPAEERKALLEAMLASLSDNEEDTDN